MTKSYKEVITELSKKTLGSYIKKSASSLANLKSTSDKLDQQRSDVNRINHNADPETRKAATAVDDALRARHRKTDDKMYNRHSGIHRAVKQLTKEDLDQLDELSKQTLGSYAKKASAYIHQRGYEAGHDIGQSSVNDDKKKWESGFNKLAKSSTRAAHVQKAIGKLMKEEEITEISKKSGGLPGPRPSPEAVPEHRARTHEEKRNELHKASGIKFEHSKESSVWGNAESHATATDAQVKKLHAHLKKNGYQHLAHKGLSDEQKSWTDEKGRKEFENRHVFSKHVDSGERGKPGEQHNITTHAHPTMPGHHLVTLRHSQGYSSSKGVVEDIEYPVINARSPADQEFVDAHPVKVKPDASGNGDDVFKGKTSKDTSRRADKWTGDDDADDASAETGLDTAGKFHTEETDLTEGGGVNDSTSKYRPTLEVAKHKTTGKYHGVHYNSDWGSSQATHKGFDTPEEVHKFAETHRDKKVKLHPQELDDPGVDHVIDHASAKKPVRYLHGKKLKEDAEQLAEISKKVLGSYLNKAIKSHGHAKFSKGLAAGDRDERSKKDADVVTAKRQKGMTTAIKKLTKEDIEQMDESEFNEVCENFEQLDEISKKTLGSYIRKAAKDHGEARADAEYFKGKGTLGYQEFSKKHSDRAKKRTIGITKATKKLTEEELQEGSRAFHQRRYYHHSDVARSYEKSGNHTAAKLHKDAADAHDKALNSSFNPDTTEHQQNAKHATKLGSKAMKATGDYD